MNPNELIARCGEYNLWLTTEGQLVIEKNQKTIWASPDETEQPDTQEPKADLGPSNAELTKSCEQWMKMFSGEATQRQEAERQRDRLREEKVWLKAGYEARGKTIVAMQQDIEEMHGRIDEAVKDIDYSITKFPTWTTEHTFVRNRFRDARDILTGGKNDDN